MTDHSASPRRPAGRVHIPISAVCNNNCIFCNETRENWDKVNRNYTSEIVYSLLEKYRTTSKGVNFTSGEPLLNPNLLSYVRRSRDLGYTQISVTTNGRMLAYKQLVIDLFRSGITEIIVSIHGHNARLHNALIRSKGGFEQTVQGLKNINDVQGRISGRVKLTTAVTVNKKNYRQLGEIVTFLKQHEPREIVFNLVQPLRQNMETHFHKLMPRYSEVAKTLEGFYSENRSLFGTGASPRLISIIDLPLCQSEILRPYLGFGETRIVEDFCYRTRALESSAPDLKTRVFVDNSGEKVKRDLCGHCQHDPVCSGVYKLYVQNFGWEEFSPVSAAQLSDG